MERITSLAQMLRVLADALADAARRQIPADPHAVVTLICDSAHAFMFAGQDHPSTVALGPEDARLAEHVARYVASRKGE